MNKKIKVCFYIQLAYYLFNPKLKGTFGGAEINLYNIAKKLSESEDIEVTFLVGDFGQKEVEKYGNIEVRKITREKTNKSTILSKIIKKFDLYKQLFMLDHDVIITSTASYLLGNFVMVNKFLKRKKIIFRLAHDLDTDLNHWKSRGFKFYNLYKLGLKNVDTIVSQTDKQKKLLKNNTGMDSVRINNGFFINDKIDAKNKKHILWVARCLEIKRPKLFIELAKKSPNEQFVMIMPVNTTKDQTLNAKLSKLKKDCCDYAKQIKNIKIINYVPFTEIQQYFDNAKLFVNTSEMEGFPNTFIQSCLGKTPILSFNINPDNIIEKYNLGCFCDNDMDKAVKFIEELNINKIQDYGNNTLKYVKEKHDINITANQYKDIILKLVSKEK